MNKRELRHALDVAHRRIDELDLRLAEACETNHRTCATEAEMERLLDQLGAARGQLAERGVTWKPGVA